MQPVVDHRLAARLPEPGVARRLERLPHPLHGEIDDGRRAAEGRRDRAGVEVIRREGAPEGELHMCVDIDTAGDDVLACRVDALGARGLQSLTDHGDLLAVDEHVAFVCVGRGHDRPVGDERLWHVAPLCAGEC